MAHTIEEVNKMYEKVELLTHADIFHLYDTGKRCVEDDSGYHDSRHFRLIAYNTETKEMNDLGIHDGIQNLKADNNVYQIRVFEDGSFFVRFYKPVEITFLSQCVSLY